MVALLSKCEEQYGIKITFSVESEPLGTGTPLLAFRYSPRHAQVRLPSAVYSRTASIGARSPRKG